jgi:hypothetical protein
MEPLYAITGNNQQVNYYIPVIIHTLGFFAGISGESIVPPLAAECALIEAAAVTVAQEFHSPVRTERLA